MRSLSPRTTERLSLSDREAGMWSSTRTMPTNMGPSVSPGTREGGRGRPSDGVRGRNGAPPPGPRAARPSLQRARQLLDGVGLDDVADLEVVHAVEPDAAIESAGYFLDVLLEAAQRADAAVPDAGAFAQQADLRGAGDIAAGHPAAGHRAGLGELEHLPHLRGPQHHLADLRLEHALERLAHLLDHLVDDLVEADLDLLAGGQLPGARVGAHVEADDDRPRGGGEQHVRFGDLAHRLADDAHLDLARAQLAQRLGERLDRAVHVALEDDLELAHRTLRDLRVDLGERDGLRGPELLLAVERLAACRDLARVALVIVGLEQVARGRRAVPAQHLDRRRGSGLLHDLAPLVE